MREFTLNKLRLVWLLSLCCYCWIGISSALAAGAIQIMSLNAEWFPGRYPEAPAAPAARHIVAVQGLLHELNPDVCLFQEITDLEALRKTLAILPDHEIHAESDFHYEPHQIVVSARLPAKEGGAKGWSELLAPSDAIVPPRGVSYTLVEWPAQHGILIFSVHFKSNYRGGDDYDPGQNVAMRETSARLLVALANELVSKWEGQFKTLGVLLAGDFNTTYPDPVIEGEATTRILEAAGFSFLGGNALDHFWGKDLGEYSFEIIDASVSDHAPIVISLQRPQGKIERKRPLNVRKARKLVGETRTDVNTADIRELQALTGIGDVLAQRIVEYRPFVTIEELVEVCGIGPMTFAELEDRIMVVAP